VDTPVVSVGAELMQWIPSFNTFDEAYDTGDHTNGSRHYQLVMLYAEQSNNDHLRAHLMAQMSLWAGLFGDGERALRLIAQAMSLVPSSGLPTARAWLGAREAAAYSRIGDKRAALEAVSRSEAAAEQARPGEEPWPWVFPFDDARIGMYRGTIATILKLPKVALPALEQGMDGLEPRAAQPHEISQRSAEEGPKLRALVLCDLAESYVASGEIEEACKLIAEALPIGTQMGSARVLRRFGEIRQELEPSKDGASCARAR
jgi:tetratricopeptide (TPR) repeat protein